MLSRPLSWLAPLCVVYVVSCSSSEREPAFFFKTKNDGSPPGMSEKLPFLSEEALKNHLGYKSIEDLEKDLSVFADRLTAGFLPKDWEANCAANHQPIMCVNLNYHFRNFSAQKTPARKKVVHDVNRMKPAQFDAIPLSELLRQSPKWTIEDIKKKAEKALEQKECPKHYAIFLAREIEKHLEYAGAYDLMHKLDEHALDCITVDDPRSEYVFLRSGLINFLYEKYDVALKRFERAYASTVRNESNRTLYWRAKSAEKLGQPALAKEAKDIIGRTFPLSWYAVVLRTEAGEDPLSFVNKDGLAPEKYFSSDSQLDDRLAWLHLLFYRHSKDRGTMIFADEVMRDLLKFNSRELLFYYSRLYNEYGFHRNQIRMLNHIIERFPDGYNNHVLALLFPQPYLKEVKDEANGLDPFLLIGLMRQESSFDPKAESSAGARGLMQVMYNTAKRYRRNLKAHELFDPMININIGVRYMRSRLSEFDGSWELALAGYNAGAANVRKWIQRYGNARGNTQLFVDLIPFAETRDYVSLILRNSYWYHRLNPELSAHVREQNWLSSQLLQQYLNYQPPAIKAPASGP